MRDRRPIAATFEAELPLFDNPHNLAYSDMANLSKVMQLEPGECCQGLACIMFELAHLPIFFALVNSSFSSPRSVWHVQIHT
jgi:hypothetical protein